MRVIVGIDGSLRSLVGVRWVSHLPLSSHDDVLLVSVVDAPAMPGAWGYTDTDVNRRAIDRVRNAAARETQRITEDTLEELRALPCLVHTVELEGHPREALEQAVREYDADLLVVGPHARGRLATILLGSVSQSLLRRMPTSILVAREPVGAPRRVLLVTDGWWPSLAAARYLSVSLLAPDAAIDVVTVPIDRSGWHPSEGAVGEGNLGTAEQHQMSGAMDEVLAVLEAAERTGMSMERDGDPTHAILAVAEERQSDLIVMGTGGVDGFRGRDRGGVSCAVSKAAACSTLVVATPDVAVGGVEATARAWEAEGYRKQAS